MPAVYVFTDLDDTLFQTLDKARARASDGPLTVAATDRAGAALSFQAPDQAALLGLFGGATLIPVTGRNQPALARVAVPRFDSYRITSHGALIYGPDGLPLQAVAAAVRAQAGQLAPVFAALLRRLALTPGIHLYTDAGTGTGPAAGSAVAPIPNPATESGVRVRMIEDAGLPVYLSLKAPTAAGLPPLSMLQSVLQASVPDPADAAGWRIHHNGHNAALLPPYACKAQAVRTLMQRLRAEDPDAVFIGLGDSLSDLPYLTLCDFAVTPRQSQIHQALFST